MTLLQHPSGYAEPCVTIRRWQMFSTEGNLVACALLGVFEVFHHSRLRAKASQGEDRGGIDLLQHHTNKQLIDRINHIASDKTVREAIKLLESKGFITIEKNPNKNKAFDRTRYFLFHPEVAQAAIDCYIRSVDPKPSHSVDLPSRDGEAVDLPNGDGNQVAPCGKSTESSLYLKRSREISLREGEENFSEQPEEETRPSPVKEAPIVETRPSPVKEAPIVETIRPTTTKGKTTPLPPSERGTLTHQALAVYAKFKPGGWVDSPTNSTALEMDILRVCQNLPSPSEFLPRIEMALKFAQDDWALKQKTGSFGDLFKFSNLIDWSDKGRKKFGDSKPTVSEEEIEARKAQADYNLRMARIRQDARDSWVNSNYSENKSAGVMAWSKFDDAQKDQIVERYITRQDQANYARLERIASANQSATAEIQEHREYAVAGGIQP